MCWCPIWERVSHARREKAATVICCNDNGWKKCPSTSPGNPPSTAAGLSCAPQAPVSTPWLLQAMCHHTARLRCCKHALRGPGCLRAGEAQEMVAGMGTASCCQHRHSTKHPAKPCSTCRPCGRAGPGSAGAPRCQVMSPPAACPCKPAWR